MKRTLVGLSAVLLAVADASGAGAAKTVPLTLTIKGSGTVKVSDKPAVSCKATCHVTLQVPAGSKVAVAFAPTTLWKLAPVRGACEGAAPKCSFMTTRAASLSVTFLAPGVRANPIPLGTAWRLPGGWRVKVVSATPHAQGVTNWNGSTPRVPPAGAQFFMPYIEATYTGGGTLRAIFAEGIGAEGSHNADYNLLDNPCGSRLPAPDLQNQIEDTEPVSSGQTFAGNICFQIATNDASSLLLYHRAHPASGGEVQTWFAMR